MTAAELVDLFDDEVDPTVGLAAERMRMALAEAGHPDAHVYIENLGIFVEGVPEEVVNRAADIVGLNGPEEPS